MRALLLILALASPQFIFVVPSTTTITAASCSTADVQAAVTAALDGYTVNIPAGSCTWTSGVTVPDDRGITIKGSGTPTGSAATIGPAASCTATTLTLTGATAFRVTPTYGASTMRVSCLQITDGSGANVAFSAYGTCTASGCPAVRFDNVTLTDWAPHATNGISWATAVIGDVFGVFDHNVLTGNGSNYMQLVQFHHARYLGVGQYGDYSWAQPEDYGTNKFLFIENNLFTAAGCCENEGSPDVGVEPQGGGRVVVRYNTFAAMDVFNFAMGWHGTESGGRIRGARAFEFYGNTWTCAAGCGEVAGGRSGTGVAWGNTISHPSGTFNAFFTLSTFRTLQKIGDWGSGCDGSSPYDVNDGTTYFSGTIASVSGSNPYTITVSGSPGWSANQWVSVGSPYSIHDVTIDDGSEITASGTNTLTVSAWTSSAYAMGDTLQILRASVCLDQAGGRGAGTLYSGDPASPASSSAQALSPSYFWMNTINNGSPGFGVEGVMSRTMRVIRNREFYVETINQAAQSSASAPFDGTTTVGAGHGLIARRPSTCTTGVSYWATDEGEWSSANGATADGRLYICTSTNTWAQLYTPYTYPHPLVV